METSKLSKPSVGLVDMPPEIIMTICDFILVTQRTKYGVTVKKDQSSISRLSQTCKRLRDITQRIVFQNFSGSPNKSRSILFLRALQGRPHLGSAVRQLELYDTGPERREDDGSRADFTPSELSVINATMDRFDFTGLLGGWIIPARANRAQCFLLLQLILLHTPRVKRVRLVMDCRSRLVYLHRYHQDNPSSVLFPELTSLDITHNCAWHCYDQFNNEVCLSEIKDGFLSHAPNLTHLSLPSFRDYHFEAKKENPLYPLANLRHLALGPHCATYPALIAHVIASAPRLESFRLCWDPLAQWYDCDWKWTVSLMWDILRTHGGEKLREIDLNIAEGTGRGSLSQDTWNGAALLEDFKVLEVFKVNDHSLQPLIKAWEAREREPPPPSPPPLSSSSSWFSNPYHLLVFQEGGFLSDLMTPLASTIREVTFWNLDISMQSAMKKLAQHAHAASVVVARGNRLFPGGKFPRLKRVVVAPLARSGPSCEEANDNEWTEDVLPAWIEAEGALKEMFALTGVDFVVEKEWDY